LRERGVWLKNFWNSLTSRKSLPQLVTEILVLKLLCFHTKRRRAQTCLQQKACFFSLILISRAEV